MRDRVFCGAIAFFGFNCVFLKFTKSKNFFAQIPQKTKIFKPKFRKYNQISTVSVFMKFIRTLQPCLQAVCITHQSTHVICHFIGSYQAPPCLIGRHTRQHSWCLLLRAAKVQRKQQRISQCVLQQTKQMEIVTISFLCYLRICFVNLGR